MTESQSKHVICEKCGNDRWHFSAHLNIESHALYVYNCTNCGDSYSYRVDKRPYHSDYDEENQHINETQKNSRSEG